MSVRPLQMPEQVCWDQNTVLNYIHYRFISSNFVLAVPKFSRAAVTALLDLKAELK